MVCVDIDRCRMPLLEIATDIQQLLGFAEGILFKPTAVYFSNGVRS